MPPVAAEPPMPGPPSSPEAGAGGDAAPRPPGTSLESRRDERAASEIEADTERRGPSGEETGRERIKVTPTRTSAMWLGVWAGVLVVILLIIFVAQNTAGV